MKQYDDAFLNVLSGYAPEPEPIPQPEAQAIYELVAAKADIRSKRLFGRYRTLLIAAIIGATLMMAAAASYGAGDLFRGVLRELDPDGRIVPLSSMMQLVDKTGKLIGETVSAYGLDVTVRGVISNANTIMLLVEMEDPTGAPIALTQEDGSLSKESIRFGHISMRTEAFLKARNRDRNTFGEADIQIGANGMSYHVESAYANDTLSKVTLLISVQAETHSQLDGKVLYLKLKDLGQYGFLRGTKVGMGGDKLYDLVTQFPPAADADFTYSGEAREDNKITEIYYNLEKNTEQKLPLASGLPEYYVTNAAVWRGTLYLNGIRPGRADGYELIPEIKLYNPKTGEYFYGDKSWGDREWYMKFEGIEALEDLRDYELVLHGGEDEHLIREGVWEFEIPLDYEDVTRVLELDQDFTSPDGFTMYISKITVSPYYLSLDLSMDKAEFGRMTDSGQAVTALDILEEEMRLVRGAIITMKDGTQIIAPPRGGGGSEHDYSIRFNMKVVIDPNEIASISFGDLTVDFR